MNNQLKLNLFDIFFATSCRYCSINCCILLKSGKLTTSKSPSLAYKITRVQPQNNASNLIFIAFKQTYSQSKLRLLTHVGFLRQNGLILSEVFCIWKGARIMKKIYNRAKKFHRPKEV